MASRANYHPDNFITEGARIAWEMHNFGWSAFEDDRQALSVRNIAQEVLSAMDNLPKGDDDGIT